MAMLLHCVQVLDNSPALKAGMEAYFDFLVSIDGVRLVGQFQCTCTSIHILPNSSYQLFVYFYLHARDLNSST